MDRTPLDDYLAEIAALPLLDAKEEHRLAARYKRTGDPELARRLAVAHLRLVVKIAAQYARHRPLLAELVQEGNVGLLVAIRKYDPTRGVRLSTYAAFWVRAFILHYLLGAGPVRVGGREDRRLFFRARGARAALEADGPTDRAGVARRLATSEEDIGRMEGLLSGAVPLDAPHAAQRDADGPSPEVQAARDEERERVQDAVARVMRGLDARERAILEQRWLAPEPVSLAALGRRFGLTRERARQIQAGVLARLKAELGPTQAAGAP